MKKNKIKWQAMLLAASLVLGLAGGSISNATHAPVGSLLWGYEAAWTNARILTYDIGLDTNPGPNFVPAGGLVPPNAYGNGRGIAYDPMDGNLWYTVLNVAGFTGDGLIHKVSTAGGPDITTIPAPVASIGALDIDPDDGHIWAAGYQPVGGLSWFYKVDRSAGAVLQSCTVPFGGGGVGNDTLAVAKLSGLSGSGKYLLTDAGEPWTNQGGPNGKLIVVDAATCLAGGPGAIVASPSKVVAMTGIDYEGGQLIATNLSSIYNLGVYPFDSVLATMSAAPSYGLEDITLKTEPLEIEVPVDIKPQSCPNPLNVNAKGVLPVAFLGTADFNVNQVDLASIKLEGVSPLRSALEDVATPFVPFVGKKAATDCTIAGADGFMDLTLKFDNQQISAALGSVTDGEVQVLKLTANLKPEFGGTPIVGEDVIVVLKKK